MPSDSSFAERLVEGFAGAAGDTQSVERIEANKQRRRNLADQELEAHTKMILGDVGALQQRRAALDPHSPTYQQDLTQIDQALHDARQVFTDLYHPENNPGALGKLGGYLQRHLPGLRRFAKPQAATPAEAKQSMADRMGGIERAAYGQSQPENQFVKLRRELKEANPEMSDADLDTAMRIQAKIEAPPRTPTTTRQYTRTGPDGKPVYQWFLPDEVPEGWTAVPTRNAPGEKPPNATQLSVEAYENSYDPPVKWADMSPEQKAFYERWKGMQSDALSTNQYVLPTVQKDGSIRAMIVEKTTEKTHPTTDFPPGFRQPGKTAAPTVPATPGQARERVPKPHAGIVSEGPIIGGRELPEATAAKKTRDILATDTRAVNAYYKNRKAGTEKSGTGDQTIVYAWVRSQVRGAGRMNNAEITNAYRAGSLETRFKNAIDKALSGTLDDTFVDQMVSDINRAYQAAAKTAQQYEEGGGPKTHVSMKKAMALPENKGKTREQVKTDIIKNKLVPIEDDKE